MKNDFPHYSQFKEGFGETLEGVFWQLPNPVPRQIPKEDERETREKLNLLTHFIAHLHFSHSIPNMDSVNMHRQQQRL